MKFSAFFRKWIPIIREMPLFFRPHFSWFTPLKLIAFSILFFILIYNFISQKPPQILGISNDKKIQEEILFWENISKKFPNYRDAYLKLSVLSWKIHLDDRANFYLDEAKKIDPNNEMVNQVENLLQ